MYNFVQFLKKTLQNQNFCTKNFENFWNCAKIHRKIAPEVKTFRNFFQYLKFFIPNSHFQTSALLKSGNSRAFLNTEKVSQKIVFPHKCQSFLFRASVYLSAFPHCKQDHRFWRKASNAIKNRGSFLSAKTNVRWKWKEASKQRQDLNRRADLTSAEEEKRWEDIGQIPPGQNICPRGFSALLGRICVNGFAIQDRRKAFGFNDFKYE